MKITAIFVSALATALFANSASAAWPTAVNSQITDAVGLAEHGHRQADHDRSGNGSEHGRHR